MASAGCRPRRLPTMRLALCVSKAQAAMDVVPETC